MKQPKRKPEKNSGKQRKTRLDFIQRLKPASVSCGRAGDEVPVRLTEEAYRQQQIREIKQRLQDGTYSVPVEKLASILMKAFLSTSQFEAADDPETRI